MDTPLKARVHAGKPANDVLRTGLTEMMSVCEHMAAKLEEAIPTATLPTPLERPEPDDDGGMDESV